VKTKIVLVPLIVLIAFLVAAASIPLVAPDTEALSKKENWDGFLKLLKDQTFEQSLDRYSDQELLDLMAEAAEQLEEVGAETELAVFVPVATERIGPHVTPTLLGSILTDPDLPRSFRQLILELGVFSHSVSLNNGKIVVEERYDEALRNILATDQLSGEERDYMAMQVIGYIDWRGTDSKEDMELFEKIFYQSEGMPWAKGRVLRFLTLADPVGMKDHLYRAVDDLSRYEESTINELMATMANMAIESKAEAFAADGFEEAYADLPEKIMEVLDAYLHSGTKEMPVSIEATRDVLYAAREIMGRTHTPGLLRYLADNEEFLPEGFDTTASFCLSMLYPEVDDMLRSKDSTDVRIALRCVKLKPLFYYHDTLEMLANQKGEIAEDVGELVSLCNDNSLTPPPYALELATKAGDWGEEQLPVAEKESEK